MTDTYSTSTQLPEVVITPQATPPPLPKPRPKPKPSVVVTSQPGAGGVVEGGPSIAPWDDYPTGPPGSSASGATAEGPAPWENYPTEAQEPKEPQRSIGTGEAVLSGIAHGASFGLTPAIAGVLEAGGPRGEAFEKAGQEDPMRLVRGGFNLLHNAFSSHPDPSIRDAYERGRQAALADETAASDQHKMAYLGGQVLGSMMLPIGGGVMAPATAAVRATRGAITGGLGGGAFGAGEAISEGKSAPEVAKAGVRGAAIGAPTGALITTALGPRAFTGTPGQRAARTAEDLGAPLPRGVISDSHQTQATASNVMSLPIIGPRIRNKVQATERAAGEHVEAVAGHMAGAATDRASANVVARPGIQAAIDANRASQDAAYNALRGQINSDTQRFTMPRTDAELNQIMRVRAGAGHVDPAAGLEQFRNVAGGATFNGAHRARTDARGAGNVLTPHPGYNAADYNRLTRAMTADLREMAQAAATNQTPRGRAAALRAFDEAERRFGPLADINDRLNRLMNAAGEGGIATLLNAAKERSGDLALLAHLRQTMPAQQFDVIGGLLLSELGWSAARGEFSLAQFATNFNKLSEGALRALYTPQHATNLRAIADMGEHVKRALQTASTSHSSNWLAFVDIVKDVALLGHDLGATGGFGKETLVGLGSTAALYGLGWILGNSARTAAFSAWTRAYQGVTLSPTPARIASFNIATRNLGNTLGVPFDKLTSAIGRHLVPAENTQPDNHQNAGH